MPNAPDRGDIYYAEAEVSRALDVILPAPAPKASRVAVFIALHSVALENFISRVVSETTEYKAGTTPLLVAMLKQGYLDAVVALAAHSHWTVRLRVVRILREAGDERHLEIVLPLL